MEERGSLSMQIGRDEGYAKETITTQSEDQVTDILFLSHRENIARSKLKRLNEVIWRV